MASEPGSFGPLPLIIPVLVSHAPGGWSAPRAFHELLATDPATILELAQHVPSFTLLVEDLVHLSNEELRDRVLAAFPKLALWFLRDGRDLDRLFANLAHWARSFEEALQTPHGIEAVRVLMRYLALVNEQDSWQEFLAKIREAAPAAEEVIMTAAEHLRAEGRVEGQATMLSKLLTLKFGELPVEYQARLTNASNAELERWAERVLAVATIDDVFAR